MQKPNACDLNDASAVPALAPFLLTVQQGVAARTLLAYVSSLPLTEPDGQLLGVVVAIRAARGGVGNISGADVSSLRLDDPHGAVEALRGLGWQVPDALVDGDPDQPVAVTVPALAAGPDRPLCFGKAVRSRVSRWTTRTLSAKPVKKTPAAVRLAALFLASHSSSDLHGDIPAGLPPVCRAGLPVLLEKGFLARLEGGRYRLATATGHLSGLLGAARAAGGQGSGARAADREDVWQFSPVQWTAWKERASPALRRHAEAVERCQECALPLARVAQAFMTPTAALPFRGNVRAAYGSWKDGHRDRGRLAAALTVQFRAEHGHGPSYNQLCSGLGWDLPRALRVFVVHRLVVNGWLTDTAPVPWTLRPGAAAQARGIVVQGRPRADAAGRSVLPAG